MKRYRAILGPIAVVLLFLAGLWCSPFEPHRPPVESPDDQLRSPAGAGDSASMAAVAARSG